MLSTSAETYRMSALNPHLVGKRHQSDADIPAEPGLVGSIEVELGILDLERPRTDASGHEWLPAYIGPEWNGGDCVLP